VLWDRDRGLPAYRGIDSTRLDNVEAALAVKLRLVALLHQTGVNLRLGTDTQQPFVVAGRALHHEMRLFGQAGLPAEDVWRLATTEAAATLGPYLGEPALGTLQPLAPADFLVYDRDPTRTLEPGHGLLAVVTAGALYPAHELNRAVTRQSVHFGHPIRHAIGVAGARRGLARLPSGR
jgi:imidazolonepropionase-like amidohydrolase